MNAAASIPGVTALSPVYGFPQDGRIGNPGFRFYVTADMVSEAHARGLKVCPGPIMADRGMRLPKPYEMHP